MTCYCENGLGEICWRCERDTCRSLDDSLFISMVKDACYQAPSYAVVDGSGGTHYTSRSYQDCKDYLIIQRASYVAARRENEARAERYRTDSEFRQFEASISINIWRLLGSGYHDRTCHQCSCSDC